MINITIDFKGFRAEINDREFDVAIRLWPSKNRWLIFHPREFVWLDTEYHYFKRHDHESDQLVEEVDWIQYRFLWFSIC